MEQVTKKHPLREFSYRADTSKKASQAERDGLEAYERFHDRIFELKTRFDQQSEELLDVKDKLAVLTQSLKVLKHHLTHLEHTLGIEVHAELPPKPEDFSTNLLQFRNLVISYGEDLDRVSEDFMQQFENQGEMIDNVGTVRSKIEDDRLIALGKLLDDGDVELSVDVESLRADFEKYAEMQKEILNQQQAFMDASRELTTQYVDLRKESVKVYERSHRLLDDDDDDKNNYFNWN